jgi:hypothetical protein
MTATSVESLGTIFTDAAAYADPEAWHATARRIRRESPSSGRSRSTRTSWR